MGWDCDLKLVHEDEDCKSTLWLFAAEQGLLPAIAIACTVKHWRNYFHLTDDDRKRLSTALWPDYHTA